MNVNDIENYVIISADLLNLDKTQNAVRQLDLFYDLYNLVGVSTPIRPCTGMFEGIPENGYMVAMPEDDDDLFDLYQDELIALGNKYEQGCILLVFNTDVPNAVFYDLDATTDEDRFSYIQYPWLQISEEEALDTDYTQIGDQYFTVDLDNPLPDLFVAIVADLLDMLDSDDLED